MTATMNRSSRDLTLIGGFLIALVVMAVAVYLLGHRDNGVTLKKITVTEQVTFCNAGRNICVAGSGNPYINRTGQSSGSIPVAEGGHTTLTIGTFPGDGTPSVIKVGD